MQKLVRLAIAGIVFVALSAVAESAQPNRVATLRAVGPHLSDEMIKRVAELAEPVVLSNAQYPDKQSSTPRQIITRLCGSVRDAYVAEAARFNGLSNLPLDEPLGQSADSFKWPACLYVRTAPEKQQLKVRAGDTAFDLYRAYTGGGGSPKAIARFFNLPIQQLENLQPGTTLRVSALSLAIPVTPRSGTAAELVEEIRLLDPLGKMVRKAENVEGEIVLGMSDGVTAAGGDCESTTEPFNAKAIVYAYHFTKLIARNDEVNVGGGRVELAVVDNGFFGARSNAAGTNPFENSPFKRAYFKSDPIYTIAAPLVLGEVLPPINYGYVEPNLESGHGTHVTGLMLGGPVFRPYLDELGAEPWASITVLNVGRGARTLVKGAYETLMSRLLPDGAWRIVNLSIAHDGRADRQVGPAYGNLFEMATTTLFVVAAGNSRVPDVRDRGIFPAAYGGIDRANVITVAAIDQSDRLTSFSNRSGQSVDLAAPGCRISSWIAYDQPPVTMSGTSQATPIVTFGAGLLRSTAIKALPATLKNRLVASGDLLPNSERRLTAFEVKLNIPHALLWLKDLIEIEENGGIRCFIGSIQGMDSVKCQDGDRQVEKSFEDMFALKRNEGVSYLYGGLLTRKIQSPCRVIGEPGGSVAFSATHEILSDGRIESLQIPLEQNWPLVLVRSLVIRTPLNELQ